MKILRDAIKLVNASRRVYLSLNFVYFGLIILAMLYTLFDRSLQIALGEQISRSFSQGALSPVLEAYSTGEIFNAVGLIFMKRRLPFWYFPN